MTTSDRAGNEERLREYARHKPGCASYMPSDASCDCGLATALDWEPHSMLDHADCPDDCEVRTAGATLDAALAADAALRSGAEVAAAPGLDVAALNVAIQIALTTRTVTVGSETMEINYPSTRVLAQWAAAEYARLTDNPS